MCALTIESKLMYAILRPVVQATIVELDMLTINTTQCIRCTVITQQFIRLCCSLDNEGKLVYTFIESGALMINSLITLHLTEYIKRHKLLFASWFKHSMITLTAYLDKPHVSRKYTHSFQSYTLFIRHISLGLELHYVFPL